MKHQSGYGTIYHALSALFLAALFANDVTVYKLVDLHNNLYMSAASVVFPITYLIIDIITEVYGYYAAKEIIWISTFVNIAFAAFIVFLIKLPSPSWFNHQVEFDFVFKNILPICLLHIVTAPLSYFINAYFLSKWKLLLKGKHFWTRSVGSTIIGEITFSLIMTTFTWWFVGKAFFILKLILVTYLTKLFWAVLGSYPANLATYLIKKHQQIDVYDKETDYNPFYFSKHSSS